MDDSTNMHPTISDYIWHNESHSTLRTLILILVGAILLTASARMSISLFGAQQNMLVLMVCLLGFSCSRTISVGSILVYCAVGLAGLPVFADGIIHLRGLNAIQSPTAGFLVGYIAAALLCGTFTLKGWDRRPLLTLTITALALVRS